MELTIADYPIHTRLCRHVDGEPLVYVERAPELGMTEMGFAGHPPRGAGHTDVLRLSGARAQAPS